MTRSCRPAMTARIAIPIGDPAGIGPEVTLRALADPQILTGVEPVLVGCRQLLEAQAAALRQRGIAVPHLDRIELIDHPLGGRVRPGSGDAASGAASFAWLGLAVKEVLAGHCDAITTAPIAKQCWHAAGHHYPGQTERLAELAGRAEASMLFTAVAPSGWRLNVLLATTHIPLRAVPDALSAELVCHKLNLLRDFCNWFTPAPSLAVAGLNPHAGERGQLGVEERDWLIPCMEAWQARNPSLRLQGPFPPDTCWLGAGRAWRRGEGGADGYLALYHDQGLIPVKLLAFDRAVNTSLGLPFVRTSPDHGTGFDIAGQGRASGASMVAALLTAVSLAARHCPSRSSTAGKRCEPHGDSGGSKAVNELGLPSGPVGRA
ncbi:MAG: 4-hydroxythreonine-4-phosphate dehydrogenase PdxA [Aphanocapsa feldmannii 277cV]|uniref:4-hydroxythreonine-4-phosphate dehydrogenase n=1 Tax=Aphanocapsa feldmannii 277cV TaxID=2507553 RepID=A0A524RP67_9CHRO|nr:MAG: 4-hydroxythreonine-4-phosphate dehydrogenase PdxA [Aphanocapsa feldmannii 288cV]TGG93139.1 MAG: 4-hydroxythreonine-4-phosphate dehydrogenase PdxA [Aphanocapsa feldmannii 277cV]